jgi:hypothetical protein
VTEVQETRQAIQVISIQIETLAQLPSVKQFNELMQKRELLIRTLPKENDEETNE